MDVWNFHTPMHLLPTLVAELTRKTRNSCLVATVDVADWLASKETIPGFERLPRIEQLFTWARSRGWLVEVTVDGATIVITRQLYLEDQPEHAPPAPNIVVPKLGE
jgi:hypothetical protein